jgi:hypothetical protein
VGQAHLSKTIRFFVRFFMLDNLSEKEKRGQARKKCETCQGKDVQRGEQKAVIFASFSH